MIGLLQRVTEASITVDGERVAEIGAGLAVLVGVERGDGEAQANRLLERLLGYRVFTDEHGKLNLSVRDTAGALLLVPQFTLPANTGKGRRPSLTPAAAPDEGQRLFDYICREARARHGEVRTGVFGAHMRFALVNDGPITFTLRVAPDA